MIKSQTDRQADRQKAMHTSPPCIRTGGLKKSDVPFGYTNVRPYCSIHTVSIVCQKSLHFSENAFIQTESYNMRQMYKKLLTLILLVQKLCVRMTRIKVLKLDSTWYSVCQDK